jgi:hypothetical protein
MQYLSTTKHHSDSLSKDEGKSSRSPEFHFYDGKENLNRGVRINTDLDGREFSEDVPTATYNPGSTASNFYSGYQR